MKTTLDTNNVLFEALKNSSLKSAITGKVYKGKRPINSNTEDVVINSLPITNEQLQRSVSNVNIFVPDINVSGSAIDKVPNYVRLKQLMVFAESDLSAGISGEFLWSIQQQTVIEDNESDSHYVNIRIDFFVSNI
jgi:hypothetical protein